MEQPQHRVNMFDTAVYTIRINGKLSENWSNYFGAQSISFEEDETGRSSTTLISEPVDQSGLVGMINLLNGLGLPLVSVECVQSHLNGKPTKEGVALKKDTED